MLYKINISSPLCGQGPKQSFRDIITSCMHRTPKILFCPHAAAQLALVWMYFSCQNKGLEAR